MASLARAGSEARSGSGRRRPAASRRSAAGSVNRTDPDSLRPPFVRLNPAFGLRSLRTNGYVPVQDLSL